MLDKILKKYREYLETQSEDKWLELEALIVADTEAVKQMSHSPGWKLLEESLQKDLRNKLRGIYELSKNPKKNETEMIFTRGIVESLSLILRRVNKLARQDIVRDEIDKIINKDVNV